MNIESSLPPVIDLTSEDDEHQEAPTSNLRPANWNDLDGNIVRWQWFHEFLILAVEFGVLPRIILERAEAELHAYRNREAPFSEWVNRQVSWEGWDIFRSKRNASRAGNGLASV